MLQAETRQELAASCALSSPVALVVLVQSILCRLPSLLDDQPAFLLARLMALPSEKCVHSSCLATTLRQAGGGTSPVSESVLSKRKLLLAQVHPSKQQGLMMLDTSQPGWQILHSDCDDERLHAKYTAGRSFWDAFAVADVVRLSCYVPKRFPQSCAYA